MEFKGNKVTEKMKRQSPFTVPDGYFDGLPSEIQNRIAAGKASKPSIDYFHLFKHQMGISIGVLVFAAVAYTGYRYNKYVDEAVVQPNDYYEYVSYNSGEFNEQELLGELNSEKKGLSKKALKRESNKIIDYLVDQQIETAAVEEELYNN
jgi:hypothetical protein